MSLIVPAEPSICVNSTCEFSPFWSRVVAFLDSHGAPQLCQLGCRVVALDCTIENVDIRPARTSDAMPTGLVHVRSWEAAYKGLVPQQFP